MLKSAEIAPHIVFFGADLRKSYRIGRLCVLVRSINVADTMHDVNQ